MGERIVDGRGRGYEAEVDADGHLHVFSTRQGEITDVSRNDGQAYVFASGPFISIPTANQETAVFHLQNDDTERALFIDDLRSCGTQIQQWRLYVGSTGGTIISVADTGSKSNLNQISSNTPLATVYRGKYDSTQTGGTMIEHWINDVGHSSEEFDGAFILGKGDSLTLTVEMPASGQVCTRTIGFYTATATS